MSNVNDETKIVKKLGTLNVLTTVTAGTFKQLQLTTNLFYISNSQLSRV